MFYVMPKEDHRYESMNVFVPAGTIVKLQRSFMSDLDCGWFYAPGTEHTIPLGFNEIKRPLFPTKQVMDGLEFVLNYMVSADDRGEVFDADFDDWTEEDRDNFYALLKWADQGPASVEVDDEKGIQWQKNP